MIQDTPCYLVSSRKMSRAFERIKLPRKYVLKIGLDAALARNLPNLPKRSRPLHLCLGHTSKYELFLFNSLILRQVANRVDHVQHRIRARASTVPAQLYRVTQNLVIFCSHFGHRKLFNCKCIHAICPKTEAREWLCSLGVNQAGPTDEKSGMSVGG